MASESKKRKLENEEEKGLTFGTGIHRKLEIDEEFEKEIQQERGIKHLKTSAEKKLDKRLIVVLENANLELGLVRKVPTLLCYVMSIMIILRNTGSNSNITLWHAVLMLWV